MMDMHLDAANIADLSTQTWDTTIEEKLSMIPDWKKSEENITKFQQNIQKWVAYRGKWEGVPTGTEPGSREWQKAMNARYKAWVGGVTEAAVGTVMKSSRVCSPNFVKKVKDMTAYDWKVSRRRAAMRDVLDALHQAWSDEEVVDLIWKIPLPPEEQDDSDYYKDVEYIDRDYMVGLMYFEGGREELIEQVEYELDLEDKFLRTEARRVRAAAAHKVQKTRIDLFDSGKVGAVVKAIYKASAPIRIINRVTNPTGTVITAAAMVSSFVQEYVKKWMSSKSGVEQTFGSMEALLQWDLTALSEKQKSTVATFYESGGKDAHYWRARPEIWAGWDDPFTIPELDKALSTFNEGKAPGPSQLPMELIKLLPQEGKQATLDYLNECLRARSFPTDANEAKMWLLPKNEQGESDLGHTRPIALMDALPKIHERLLCTRIQGTLVKHKMLDPAQFGAVPGGGTGVPLDAVAAMLDDANFAESNPSLHMLSLDLSKAFDSCEFWS
jgi:hypothetical protein